MSFLLARASRNVFLATRTGARRLSSSSSSAAAPSTRLRFPISSLLAVVAVGSSAYGLGSVYPPELATLISPRSAPPPLPPDSPEGIAQTAQLEEEMMILPILQRLRQEDTTGEWYETRPFSNIDPTVPQIRNHLLLGALRAPGRLAVPPLVRARKDETAAYAFIHIGRGLCGHDGVAHGGLLATLIDEASARTALLNLESHVGVTARLEIDYKAPLRAGRFVVIRTTLVEKKGRKVIVEGAIEDVDGTTVYAKSRAIFVEPKYAKLLGSGEVLKALGVPPPAPTPGSN